MTDIRKQGVDSAQIILPPYAPSIQPYNTTSSTEATISDSAALTFTVARYLSYAPGARVRVASAGSDEWMEGIVTAYAGDQLTVRMDRSFGIGSHSDWTIRIAGTIAGVPVLPYGAVLDGMLEESHFNGAATFALKTIFFPRKDPTRESPITYLPGSGVPRAVVSPLSLTIPEGATMGVQPTTPFRLWFALVDNAGYETRLAAIQTRAADNTITVLTRWPLMTTQTPPANNAGTFYSNKAVTNQPYVIFAFADYDAGLAQPGNWNVSPSRIVLYSPGSPIGGEMIGVSFAASGAFGVGRASIPLDDTIPQINEGVQFLSIMHKPTDLFSVYAVEAQILGTSDIDCIPVAALFKQGQANALAATWGRGLTCASWRLRTTLFLGSLAPVIFTLRVGGDPAFATPAGTPPFFFANADKTGTPKLGGSFNSFMRVIERMT